MQDLPPDRTESYNPSINGARDGEAAGVGGEDSVSDGANQVRTRRRLLSRVALLPNARVGAQGEGYVSLQP
ncbi:MAG TPA: hypothetical protein VH371_10675, partial [Candidatus Limnocylindrales bacterium]